MTSDTSKTEGRIIMSEDIGKDDGKLMWKKTSIVARNQLDDEENKGSFGTLKISVIVETC
uniref:Uncharacterized protein n=1 Tax=Solanum tuberosum TaxID=4113 RepID=M1A0Y6_SOLTU